MGAKIHHPSDVFIAALAENGSNNVSDAKETLAAAIPEESIAASVNQKIVKIYYLLTLSVGASCLASFPIPLLANYILRYNSAVVIGIALPIAAGIYIAILKTSKLRFGLNDRKGVVAQGLACWSLSLVFLFCVVRCSLSTRGYRTEITAILMTSSLGAIWSIDKLFWWCRLAGQTAVSVLVCAVLLILVGVVFRISVEVPVSLTITLVFQTYISANVELILRKHPALNPVGVVHQLTFFIFLLGILPWRLPVECGRRRYFVKEQSDDKREKNTLSSTCCDGRKELCESGTLHRHSEKRGGGLAWPVENQNGTVPRRYNAGSNRQQTQAADSTVI